MGFAAKAVNLRRLQMSLDVEREWKSYVARPVHAVRNANQWCMTNPDAQVLQVEIWKQLPAHPNMPPPMWLR